MGDIDHRLLSEAVSQFYEAAMTPAFWPGALKTLSNAFNGSGSLFLYPQQSGVPWHACSPGLEESVDVFFREGWYSQNFRMAGREFMARNNLKIFTETDLLTPAQLDLQPIQADFFDRFDLRSFLAFNLGPIQASIERGKEPFTTEQASTLNKVLPHLQQAGRLATALGIARNEGALETFTTMRTGAALLDYAGRVTLMNPEAERLLNSAARLQGGMIIPHDRDATAALRRMIGMATSPGLLLSGDLTEMVALKRPQGRPLFLRIAPLVNARADMFQMAKAILTIIDPYDRPDIAHDRLMRLLGLTPAEARVAKELARGATLAEIADEFNLSMKTVRTQLRSIFAKTETHRQSDLIALLMRIFLTPQ
ncbi:MAG: LuxR C-terminal-related transcriptional regulator [Methylovirgula sp.]|uniref:helix-turn-helix transcriptional regulator n=1 Tax=Methylovirgula sp. TaxID=1978224 RepID=UPI0030766348